MASITINLYSDGSSKGNPGPGGYGTILEHNGKKKEFSGGFRLTTNNRMELMSVIVGLEALKKDNCIVNIYSDSKYVVDAINKNWIWGWQKKNFNKVKNPDLWKRLLEISKKHKTIYHWIKGHAGHIENERCDQLAVEASTKPNLSIDEEFEKTHQQ